VAEPVENQKNRIPEKFFCKKRKTLSQAGNAYGKNLLQSRGNNQANGVGGPRVRMAPSVGITWSWLGGGEGGGGGGGGGGETWGTAFQKKPLTKLPVGKRNLCDVWGKKKELEK